MQVSDALLQQNHWVAECLLCIFQSTLATAKNL